MTSEWDAILGETRKRHERDAVRVNEFLDWHLQKDAHRDRATLLEYIHSARSQDAVAAEREACAKIADDYAAFCDRENAAASYKREAAKFIASRIRARTGERQ